MISMPAGIRPDPMMAATAPPAAATESKTAISARADSGFGRMRRVARVITHRSPSEPVNRASRSYPARSMAPEPMSTISPSESTTCRPRRLFVVVPYFRQCTPPAFSATLPPMVQAIWLDGSGA